MQTVQARNACVRLVFVRTTSVLVSLNPP
ncbi:hypothetical protein NC651_004557 [Populus alba x Populus x berolinensis]|nr:hypothetical protein NC651_004557 [Populus alba x Populus x berolinensis]